MDGMTILDQAAAAGLTVTRDGDQLMLAGPKDAAHVVELIRQHKPDVLQSFWAWQAERVLETIDDEALRSDLADMFNERMAIVLADSGDEQTAAMLALGELIAAMLRQGLDVHASKQGREVER